MLEALEPVEATVRDLTGRDAESEKGRAESALEDVRDFDPRSVVDDAREHVEGYRTSR